MDRPGRFRRWVLRPVLWLLVLLAVLAASLHVFVDSRPGREWLRSRLVSEIATRLERAVILDAVEIDLLPLELRFEGLEIGGGEGADGPFLEVPRGRVEIEPSALQQRRLHLSFVRLEEPRIDVRFFPEGGSNLPWPRGREDPRPFELWIDQLEIDRAHLGVEHQQVPLTLEAESVRTRLRGLGDFALGGSARADAVRVRLPWARPIEISVHAEGRLDAAGLVVESARLVHPLGQARAEGGCEWRRDRWQNRKCTFRATGSAEGEILRRLGYFSGLDGAVDFAGSLAWRPGSLGWRGPVGADRVSLWGRRLEQASGVVSADRFGVRLALESARYAGGRLDGQVGLDIVADGRPLTADLDFADLRLDDLLADQAIAVEGLAARVDAHLLYVAPFSDGLGGDGHAEVTIRADPRAPGLPVSGVFPLRIESGVVRADAANLRSARQTLLLAGSYGARERRGRFDYEIESLDVAELVPLLPIDEEPLPAYLPTAGRGRLEGLLDVGPGEVYSQVRVRLEDVSTPNTDADSVSGSFAVTPWAVENLDLALVGPPGQAEARLDVRGRLPFDGARQASLEVDADDWPLAEVRPWLDFDLPLDGRVTGQLEIGWDERASRGRMAVTLTPARWPSLDFEVDGLLAELDWDPRGLRIDSLRAVAAAGSAEARGTVPWMPSDRPSSVSPSGSTSTSSALADPRAPLRLDLDLVAEHLDLDRPPFDRWLPRPDLEARVAVRGHLGGSWDAPLLELETTAHYLALAGRPVEGPPATLVGRWDGRRLGATGRLASATLEGGGRLDRQGIDLALGLEAPDLGTLLELLGHRAESLSGRSRGTLRIRGENGAPSVALELDELELAWADRRLRTAGPAVLALDSERIRITNLDLRSPDTRGQVFVEGDLGWLDDAPLSLAVLADFDADWLRPWLPELEPRGRLELDGRIVGSVGAPRLEGRGAVRELALAVPGLDQGFSELEGSLQFLGDRVRLERWQGRLSRGRLALSGEASLGDDGLEYRFELEGRDVEVPYLRGWGLAGDLDMSLRSQPEGQLLSGSVELDRLDYLEDIRFDFAQMLRDFVRGQRSQVESAADELARVQLEIRLEAPDSVRLRNNLARLDGSADLVLRGSLAKPVLFGEVTMEPGGELVYRSEEYELERGRLLFADPYGSEPEVDLVATTEVRDFDVTLALSGPLDRLDARFSSEPPLPDVEVFRLLAGGDTYVEETELAPDRTAELGEETGRSAATLLYGQAASAIGDRVNSLFGFDKFRIDPLTGSDDNLSKARLTVGKRLSKDVFVTYSVDPSSSENQRIRVEWQVADGLVLVLTQNGDNTYSADARWETSF